MRMSRLALILTLAVFALPHAAAAQIGGIKKPKIPSVPKVPTVAAPTTQPEAEAAPAAAEPTTDPAATPAKSEAPGSGVWVNYDFQPGEIPLYVDDFSRDRVGNFPKRLEFIAGNMEVAEWNGARYLRSTTRGSQFAIVLPETLTERFTIEFDATASSGNISTFIRFAPDAPSHVRYYFYNTKMGGGVDGTGPKALGADHRLPGAARRLPVPHHG